MRPATWPIYIVRILAHGTGINDLEQFANAKVVESLNALFAGVEPGTGVPLKCPPCAVTELRGDWKFFKEFGSKPQKNSCMY